MANLGNIGDDGFQELFQKLSQEIEGGLVSDDILKVAITSELVETLVTFASKWVIAMASKGFEQAKQNI